MNPKKSLGQHWLHDEASLEAMVEAGEVREGDRVLEVGPGLGTLTEVLIDKGAHVTAVEFDEQLASELTQKYSKNDRIEVINQDILEFDLSQLGDYKIVANIPYYLTGKLVRKVFESANKPLITTLLVQKEVAERLAAKPGQMSIIAVVAQHYSEVSLGPVVPAELFTPPPKVDSQIVRMELRAETAPIDEKKFFRLVKAGFGERRKKLINSLSGGMDVDKEQVKNTVIKLGFDENVRAQELTLEQWYELYQEFNL